YPLRALVKSTTGVPKPLVDVVGVANVDGFHQKRADALSRSPWVGVLPTVMIGVLPVHHDGGWGLRAGEGGAWRLPLGVAPGGGVRQMVMRGAGPVRRVGRWVLGAAQGAALGLPLGFAHGWELMAISGGHPITVFGEVRDDEMLPLSVMLDGRLIPLREELE